MRILLLSLLLFYFSACINVEKKEATGTLAKSSFFDIEAFFDSEIERLSGKKPQLKKTILMNGEEESLVLKAVDFEKELRVFSECHLNKPALEDKYSRDSIFESGQLVKIIYETGEEKIKIKKVEISFEENSVSRILIEKNASSEVTSSSQVLTYQPNLGYTIESKQKFATSSEHQLKMQVSFVE